MRARPANVPYEADKELAAPVKLAIGGEVEVALVLGRTTLVLVPVPTGVLELVTIVTTEVG